MNLYETEIEDSFDAMLSSDAYFIEEALASLLHSNGNSEKIKISPKQLRDYMAYSFFKGSERW